MASRPVFYRAFVLASALSAGFLTSIAPALADRSHNRHGWQARHHVQHARVYHRQTIIVRKDRNDHNRNDHNRDALTNAALLRQSILLSRAVNGKERCRGGISSHSNCTTRGGALIVGTGR